MSASPKTKRGGMRRPHLGKRSPPLMARGLRRTCAPHIYASEQEQPYHVDEVPVPGGKLESDMLLGRELASQGADQAHNQEDRTDDDMKTMEPGRHEERRAVDVARIMERRVHVLVGLNTGERDAERNGEDEPPFEALAIVLQQRVVRPGHRGAGGQQDQRVEERQVPRIES